MPQIREYRARVGAGPVREGAQLDPNRVSLASGVAKVGAGLGMVGDVLKKNEDDAEVSTVSAQLAKTQAEFTNKWKETLRTADPSDREIGGKFLEGLDEHLGKIEDGINSSEASSFFVRQKAQLRAQFEMSTFAGQAELAGVKAVTDYKTSMNALSSSLLADPSSFESTMAMHGAATDELIQRRGLSTEVAEKLKAESRADLAKAAVRGWIKLNPEDAKAQLASGKYDPFFDGDVKKQLFGESEVEISGRRAEKERIRVDQERAIKVKQEQTQNTFLEKMSKGELKVRDILDSNLEAFGSGSKQQFINMMEEESKSGRSIKTDPGTFKDLFERIHAPDTDPKKLRDENDLNQYFGRGLNMESLNQLRGEISGKKTAQGAIEADLKKGVSEIAKGMLTRSNALTGMRDPAGDEQYQKFMSFFLFEYQEQTKKGKTAKELLDPESPDYLGKHIRRFARSQNQIMQDMIKSQNAPAEEGLSSTSLAAPAGAPVSVPSRTDAPGAAPSSLPPTTTAGEKGRLPGESAADFLKRVKGGK